MKNLIHTMKKSLDILITAGGTREYLDPVRFISNASSGKMGYALACAAVRTGHKVTLIAANTMLKAPASVKVIDVVTSDEMFGAVKENFDKCDCLIMAAAVSDYKPAKSSKGKNQKGAIGAIPEVKAYQRYSQMGRTAQKDRSNPRRFCAGRYRRVSNLVNAEKKLKSKKLDMIVAPMNQPPSGPTVRLCTSKQKQMAGKHTKTPPNNTQLL